jgi:O-methyltransferase
MKATIRYAIDTVSRDYVEGWAFGRSGPCTVDVVVGGRTVGRAMSGLPRPDVAAALPRIRNSGVSGFLYTFRDADFTQVAGDVPVWLRLAADDSTLETEKVCVPVFAPSPGELSLARSPFPAAITELLVRNSPALANGDLASEAGACAALDVLEHLFRRGPRPLPGMHRYLGFLRTVYHGALFAARYFPKANTRPTGAKDVTSILTGPNELTAIAHHLYVVAERGVPGGLLEFGCYKGFSTSVLSTACHLLGRPMGVFDSFEGLPTSGSTYYRAGEFTASLDEAMRNITEFGRPDVVTFHRGFFSESVARWTPCPVSCLWLDVDLEQSAIDALEALSALDPRAALFSHESRPEHFDGGRPVPQRGPDDVIGPIVDAFRSAGREPVGVFLSGYTAAFWDARHGIPVLPQQGLERLLRLVME